MNANYALLPFFKRQWGAALSLFSVIPSLNLYEKGTFK